MSSTQSKPIFIAACALLLSLASASAERPNVLLIAIDDLRPELGCYGAPQVHSPNIDQLAASGRRFERAYCQQAVCNPSRTSLMTGMRPDTIGVTGNHTHFRSHHPDVVTLPQHFKNHGYHAAAIGKIYHGVFPAGASITKWDTMGDPESWSVPAVRFGPRYYYTEEGIAAAKQIYEKVYRPKDPGPDDWTQKLVFGPATESPDVSDSTLYDGQVAEAAVEALRELAHAGKPFFLAVGFIKPHSPYIAPKKYFDFYEQVALPSSTKFPSDAPKFAGHGSGELRRYTDQPKRGAIPEQNQRRVRQAYFACVSYIDAQVGRVLEQLRKSGLDQNTIVALYGDHGYHLGEQGLWGKTTNFELDTRVPLIVRSPSMNGAGESSKTIVELVDLYPTLAELAGLPVPVQLEGVSFAANLSAPDHVTKSFALSQYPRGGGLMGYSMRTETHRLTQWLHRESGDVRATELYDYSNGPVETRNIAEEHPDLVDELSSQLSNVLAETKKPEPVLADGDSGRQTRPNILLIVGEDHGCELSCYGDPVITSPNIDRLASQGVLFENGYVTQSVCSPSRSTIFTGLYPHQNGQLGLATHQYGWFEEFPTTYSLLKEAGYRTGLIGKTHVIPADAVESFVDFRFQTGSNFAKRAVDQYAAEAGEFFRSSSEPFFMTVNYPDAHWPLQGQVDGLPANRVDPERVQVMPYIGHETPRMRTVVRNYYDCMLRLDACVGQLLRELEKSGKANDTLVVFIGDHGAQMARGKVTVYEGGMRVPYIVRWPRVTRSGHRSDALVSTIDLLPTFMDAAEVKPPPGLPGRSLRPVLEPSCVTFREYVVCERNCDAARHTFPQRTIRDTRYKLIYSPVQDREDPAARYYRDHGATHWSGCLTDEELAGASERTKAGYARWLRPPEYQLYDLREDPHEWTDLAEDPRHEEVKQRLQTALADWQQQTKDWLADPNKLRLLMEENDAVLKAGRRSPKNGWRYLQYLK